MLNLDIKNHRRFFILQTFAQMKAILYQFRNLICAILAGIGLLSTGCAKPKYTWSTEAEYYDLPIWKQHVKQFKKMKAPIHLANIFIGDSMTEGFDLNRHLDAEILLNMGISGDFTSGVLRRIKYAIDLQPKRIFIMIGINDILKSVPQERIKSQYAEIISTLRKETPSTIIYIESNLPTTNMGGNEIANQAVVARVQDLNSFLQTLCTDENIRFVNLYPEFQTNENHLISEYSYDGLHLNDNGYKIWAEQVQKLLTP
jgi:lysophospholipase L1-like esterase